VRDANDAGRNRVLRRGYYGGLLPGRTHGHNSVSPLELHDRSTRYLISPPASGSD
jgi:hypothetical protein